MPAIVSIAEKDGWVVVPLVRDGCAPVSWLRYPSKRECPAWHKWAMAQATELRPDLTVIAGNWSYLGTTVAEPRTVVHAMSRVSPRTPSETISLTRPNEARAAVISSGCRPP